MLDRDHVTVSETVCLGWLVSLHTNNLALAISCIAGTYLGSQLPDIDTTSSTIGKCTRPVSNFIAHFGHRGLTHSLWGLGICFLLINFLLKSHLCSDMYVFLGTDWTWLLNWILFGYGLHLIEDWFSWPGLIWLFPLGRYRAWRPVPQWIRHKHKVKHMKHYTRKEKQVINKEPPIYVKPYITKWFRYHSTDRGRKGQYERNIRRISHLILIIELIMLLIKA